MDAMVLEGANHLQAGPVSHMRQAGVLVSPKVALENAAVTSPVEEGAPALQLTNPVGCLLRMKLCHPPVVYVLATAHGVREVHLPGVPVVHVSQRGRDSSLGHHGVRLAQQ